MQSFNQFLNEVLESVKVYKPGTIEHFIHHAHESQNAHDAHIEEIVTHYGHKVGAKIASLLADIDRSYRNTTTDLDHKMALGKLYHKYKLGH